MNNIEIIEGDLTVQTHRDAFLSLLNAYTMDSMGKGTPLDPELGMQSIRGLSEHPMAFSLFACEDGRFIGMTVCFVGFSTFTAKKLINIHDLVVLPQWRNCGVGRRLLAGVEAKARQMDCCKITLEVREDNISAQHLYLSFGFEECEPPMLFWKKAIG